MQFTSLYVALPMSKVRFKDLCEASVALIEVHTKERKSFAWSAGRSVAYSRAVGRWSNASSFTGSFESYSTTIVSSLLLNSPNFGLRLLHQDLIAD